MKKYTDIDGYIKNYPKKTQVILEKIRTTIKKVAPKAEETIGYGIPTFKLNGNLVHFGGYENHIGFYPGPKAIEVFKKEIAQYKTSKGAIQFPLDKPLPLSLIRKIVSYRVMVNMERKKEVIPKKLKVCTRGHKYSGAGPCSVCWPGRYKKKTK